MHYKKRLNPEERQNHGRERRSGERETKGKVKVTGEKERRGKRQCLQNEDLIRGDFVPTSHLKTVLVIIRRQHIVRGR